MKRVSILNIEQAVYGVFCKPLFKHRHEDDQQASPWSLPKKLTILECKTHKDEVNLWVEQRGAFKKGETFGLWDVD